ncbi:MAG: hypothetical protein DMF22_00185 [Verrucomicrobia bacterium]|nr:MAG: hypothetical protein DME68_08865 [Verrucomicrobiota bacterium]PYL73922.1 MAG: hypothetical protein DMF22_00185 [Verrucomicrobiota bacterium]
MTKSEFTPVTVCVYCKERKPAKIISAQKIPMGKPSKIQIDIFSIAYPYRVGFHSRRNSV